MAIFSASIIERHNISMVHEKLLNPEFHGALLSSEEHIAFLNRLNAKKSPQIYFYFADEIFFGFNLCIYLHRQSCLTENINHNILKFKDSGFLKVWVKEFVDRSYLKERKVVEPKVLVNDQLLGAYEMLAAGLLLGVFIFLLEICSVRNKCLREFLVEC